MKVFWFKVFSLILLTLPSYGQEFETLQADQIRIKFEKAGDDLQIQRFRKTALSEIDRILSDISSDLGGRLEQSNLTVAFYSSDTFAEKFPFTVKKKIPAFFKRGEGVHARYDNDLNEGLKQTLRHELTHFYLDSKYGNLPSWLDEGLAQYMERQISVNPNPNFPEYNTLVVENQNGNLLSLKQLESRAYYSRTHGTIHAGQAYVVGFIAVHEMVRKGGMHSLRNFLQDLSQRKSPEDVFLKHFGMSYKSFDEHLLEVAKKGAAA